MVQLVPMSESDYLRFLEWAISDYAQGQIRAETWKAKDAQRLAEETFQSLLPDGLSTPNQYLCSIIDEALDQPVGYLWYGVRDREGDRFVMLCEFVILEAYRRRGYGTEALRALEEKVKELGMDRIILHVFGYNEAARALYKKVGYVERNVTMAKKI